jgi:hypothetical protein
MLFCVTSKKLLSFLSAVLVFLFIENILNLMIASHFNRRLFNNRLINDEQTIEILKTERQRTSSSSALRKGDFARQLGKTVWWCSGMCGGVYWCGGVLGVVCCWCGVLWCGGCVGW